MSEIKPVAYTSQHDLDIVRKGKSGDIYGSQKWEGSDDAVFTVPLYTAEQLAEAVAAERERCLRIVMSEGITPSIPDDPDPVAEAINGALQNVHEAIRSATK